MTKTQTLEGVEIKVDGWGNIEWVADAGAPQNRRWIERGLVDAVDYASGEPGGSDYRLTEEGVQLLWFENASA